MKPTRSQITLLLEAHSRGDEGALRELFPLVYQELLQIARNQRRRLHSGQTLDTVGLVHDCFLKLADSGAAAPRDRGHFFAVAASAMRHLLIDYARSRSRQKRRHLRADLDAEFLVDNARADELLLVNRALERLAEIDPRLLAVAECRYFAGLSVSETAEVMGISPRTVNRVWMSVRTHLGHELGL